jgi:hypothetical protein
MNMTEEENKTHLFVDNYGEMLAQVNGMELVSFETDGGYQGDYCAILTDGERLFYYIDSYGSCGGCDWLEDVETGRELDTQKGEKRYAVEYKEALDFCGGLKPKYIVPKNMPLEIKNGGEYEGFEIISGNVKKK